MQDFKMMSFSQNEVIFKEGSMGDVAYILKSGQVEISVFVNDRKVVLHKLDPVTIFGEMALILDDHRRTATAVALEYCEAIEVTKKAVDEYIVQSPKFITTVLTAIVNRLQKTTLLVTKPIDVFMALSELFNLMASNGLNSVSYDETVLSLANAFSTDADSIRQTIDLMVSMKLLVLDKDKAGQRCITVSGANDFMQRATKMHRALFVV